MHLLYIKEVRSITSARVVISFSISTHWCFIILLPRVGIQSDTTANISNTIHRSQYSFIPVVFMTTSPSFTQDYSEPFTFATDWYINALFYHLSSLVIMACLFAGQLIMLISLTYSEVQLFSVVYRIVNSVFIALHWVLQKMLQQ